MSENDKSRLAQRTGIDSPRIPDHELLRAIGGGSYGTVWLARTTVGTFRAVKVVERARFEEARPYEREYEGLKLFEPVSRAHEGLVDILHLGRDEEEGYFYYVMEAADDVSTGQQIDPVNYTPRTLERDIKTRGRLPARECLEVSVALAEALAFLHENDLVHRDLKPSNIVFVGGVPKVADIGLVAQAGAGTFVGSEGFVAPEGPGKPQADIYSLGKMMYELAMGKDRQAFPSPPTQLAEWADRQEVVELNDIISRACEPDLRRRYRSAADLRADLVLLREGGRPSRVRRKRALMAGLAKAGAAAFLIMAMVFVGWVARNRTLAGENQWQLTVLTNLTIPEVKTWRFAQVGHYRNDGEADVFVTSSNQLFIKSVRGADIGRWPIAGADVSQLHVELAPHMAGNGQDAVFVTWRAERTNLNVALFNGGVSPPKHFTRTGGLAPDGESGSTTFSETFLTDFEGDGVRELVAVLSTSYGTGPRGVCCFNFENEQSRWEFLTAPYVQRVQIVRLRKDDGPLDLLFGSNAPNNGKAVADGLDKTDDSHCYLYAISGRGEKLWRQEIADEYTTCQPLLVQSTGLHTKEVIAAVWRSPGLTNDVDGLCPEIGRMVKYDQDGKFISSYDLGACLVSHLAADFDGDGKPEIFATDRFGRLHILDSRLKPIRIRQLVPPRFHKQLDRSELVLDAVEDINNDGRKELIFHCSQMQWISGVSPKGGHKQLFYDNRVLMFDTKLNELAACLIADKRSLEPIAKVVPAELTRNGRKVLVVLGDEATVLEVTRR